MTEPLLERIDRRWQGRTVVVAATGPSLTQEVADLVRDEIVVAVSDAWRLLPWADVLYSCDAAWWHVHKGAPGFAGERWSCHGGNGHNDKSAVAKAYGVRLVAGKDGKGFSTDPSRIHFGHNSGFQACNLAILAGAARVVLVGFDMRAHGRRLHFFGDHPKPLHNALPFYMCLEQFQIAAQLLWQHPGVEVINATPGSALTCFPMRPLAEALQPELVTA